MLFSFRVYQRPFQTPLQTAHGSWCVREGIWVKLTDPDGQVGYGEIAPIPWFGSETLDEALAFCHQFTFDQLNRIPDRLPATQFGFESALNWLRDPALGSDPTLLDPASMCALLPTGSQALTCWQPLWSLGHRTFKWKIGVAGDREERELLETLLHLIPPQGRIRLDANGGLSWAAAQDWFKACDQLPRIEFLEQPLPPAQFQEMQQLCQQFQTPVALDESVAQWPKLVSCLAQGWQGIVVIKPSIFGSPTRLRQVCQERCLDVVISSALETGIGRRALLQLAQTLECKRVLGLGIDSLFTPDPCNPKDLWTQH